MYYDGFINFISFIISKCVCLYKMICIQKYIYICICFCIQRIGLGGLTLVNKTAQEISKEISEYLEAKVFKDPPEPFILSGTIMKDLSLTKSQFYTGIGRLIGFKVGEYAEGKKRYYYLLELVQSYRDQHKGR